MRKVLLVSFLSLLINACSSVPSPQQYDLLLQGETSDESMAELIEEAKSGNAELQVYLGNLHEKGRHTKPSFTKAVDWYRMAAEQGDEKGRLALIKMLYQGENYYDKTLYAELGDYYYQGKYVEQDSEEALNIYLASASTGGQSVQNKLINLLNELSAQSCPQTESLACIQLRAKAQYELAMLYRTGRYLAKDKAKSQQLMTQSASTNNSKALIKVASDLIGEERTDWFEVRRTLEKVTTHSAWSASVLGNLYYRGQGADVDKDKSLQFYQLSAELGDGQSAYYAFGMHQDQDIATARYNQAGTYLWLAAKADHDGAKSRLARAYLYGEFGIPADAGAAANIARSESDIMSAWLCKEAYFPNVPKACIDRSMARLVREEHPYGMYLMGQVYADGVKRGNNIERAISLFESAIQQGNVGAKLALGELYLSGKAGDKHVEQGKTLLNEMVNDGQRGAAQVLAHDAFEQGEYSRALTLSLEAEKEQFTGVYTFYELSRLYGGIGILPKDTEKSEYYMTLALNEFDPDALYDKALTLLSTGSSLKRQVTGIKLLKYAANQSNVPAMLKLAEHYNTIKQPEQAAIWILEAAANGDANSQVAVGQRFASSKALSEVALGRYWYAEAEKQGNVEAIAWMAKSGEGNLDIDREGKICDKDSDVYCYSVGVQTKPTHYFSQKAFSGRTHKLRLYADGSVKLSDEIIPHADWAPYLKANVSQVWQTHCGFALNRATGSSVLLFSRTAQFCQPTHDVVMDVFKHGIKDVAHSANASGILLNNGQVVTWGGTFSGGGLIVPFTTQQDMYESLAEETKVKRAVARDVKKLVSATMSMAALKEDGHVYMWGDSSDDIQHQLPGKYKDVMANGYFDGYCTRNMDDQITCWKERSSYRQNFPKNLQQFELVENAFMALSINDKGRLNAWPMYMLGTGNYWPAKVPAELKSHTWLSIDKEQIKEGFVTVLTRSDGKRFSVKHEYNDLKVRAFVKKY